MKLHKFKMTREQLEAKEQEEQARNEKRAFHERRQMLDKLADIDDPWERWHEVYNVLTTTDLILILIMLLFFGDMPEEGKVEEDDTRL